VLAGWPRVVGLLATRNRPDAAHRAAHLFFEQDYRGPKTLLIFDDGDVGSRFVPCPDLIEADIVYHAHAELPAKRNQMVEYVDDPDAIYVVWDDDDYHGPGRLRRQVQALLQVPQAGACLIRPVLYYDAEMRSLWRCAHAFDATIAFRHAFWLLRPWEEDQGMASGHRFVINRGDAAYVNVDGQLDYVVVWRRQHALDQPDLNDASNYAPAPVHASTIERLLRSRP
jgi:hypothetical protein